MCVVFFKYYWLVLKTHQSGDIYINSLEILEVNRIEDL